MADQDRDAARTAAAQQQGGDREVRRGAQDGPGGDAGADAAREGGAITTMVCITCGNEEFFEKQVPDTLTCRKCQGTVFRAFETPAANDEIAVAQLEEQARSMAYGDASPATSPDEVRDLDAR